MYPFFGHPYASKLSLSEVLYTARGSQGLGTEGLTEDRYGSYVLHDSQRLEDDKWGSIVMVISFETQMQKTHYVWRPLWQMEYCPGFTMAGKIGRRMPKQASLASLPLFAKYARVRMSEIPMTKLLVKLKD